MSRRQKLGFALLVGLLAVIPAEGAGHRPADLTTVPPPAGVLLSQCADCPGASGGYPSMFTVQTDGRRLRLLARGGENPRWSPDGRQIAYARSGEEIWVSGADGTKPRRVTRRLGRGTDEGFQDSLPTWFPAGKRLAFVRSFAPGHDPERLGSSEPWTVDADGRGPKRIFAQFWLVSTTDGRRKSIFRTRSGSIESGLDRRARSVRHR